MDINMNGYMEQMATFKAASTLTETGVPVMLSDNMTVSKCSNGTAPIGVCIAIRDGYATVQTHGYVKVSTASKLALGYKAVSADASGNITVGSTGRYCIIADSTDNEAGIIL